MARIPNPEELFDNIEELAEELADAIDDLTAHMDTIKEMYKDSTHAAFNMNSKTHKLRSILIFSLSELQSITEPEDDI